MKRVGCILMPLLVLFWVSLFTACQPQPVSPTVPTASGGLIDLRGWDFTRQGTVQLNGQWAFFWHSALAPEHYATGREPPGREWIMVPGAWHTRGMSTPARPRFGYGTYHLRVLMPPGAGCMAFKLLSVGTAFNLYVNGEKITSAGVFGPSPQNMVPDWRPHVAAFDFGGGPLDLVLQVSNFHHRKGGLVEAIRLGPEKEIRSLRELALAQQLFLGGSIFIMALYHLGLFYTRRTDRAPLFFGLFCLFIAVYTLLSGERFFAHLFAGPNWALRVKLTNLTSFLSVPFFLSFVGSLFPRETPRKTVHVLQSALLLLALAVLLTPARIYTHAIPIYHGLTLMSALTILYILVRAGFRRREGVFIFLGGFCILFGAMVNDILYDHLVIHSGQFVHVGLFVFIFSQSFLLLRRFSRAFHTVERQGRALNATNRVLNREIVERRHAETALAESEEKYRGVVQNASETIFVIQENRIAFANTRAVQLSGYSLDDLIGRDHLGLIHPDDRTKVKQRYIQRLAGDAPPTNYQLRVTHKEGRVIWAQINSVRIEWGRRPAVLTFLSDISERKAAEEALRQVHLDLDHRVRQRTAELAAANQKLKREISERKRTQTELLRAKDVAEAASRAKSDFLANMSHELRTPLNHIIGFTELVVHKDFGELNPLQEEYLTDALQSGRHLLALINDILDLSKVEAGKYELSLTGVKLAGLLENSLGMIKDKTMEKDIRVSTRFTDIPATIVADERKLKQILYNLLSNAVKFTPVGGAIVLGAAAAAGRNAESITVDGERIRLPPGASQRPLPADGRWVLISVRDTGVGIARKDLERIFRPFEQADLTSGKRFAGTGLGLSLSQRLVELHGGRIWVHSEGQDRGSDFRFILPCGSDRSPNPDQRTNRFQPDP